MSDCVRFVFCFFKQKTAYEMRISDWSSDVFSSDLRSIRVPGRTMRPHNGRRDPPLCCPECRRNSPRAKVLLYDPEGDGCADFLGLRRCPRCTVAARVATILLQCKAGRDDSLRPPDPVRSDEHTSELQSLMRIS